MTKSFQRVAIVLAVLLLGVALIACGKDKLEVSGPDSVEIGKEISLEVKGLTEDDGYWIVFESSDKSVASVDLVGKVKGLKEGEVTITVEAWDESKPDAEDPAQTTEIKIQVVKAA